MRPDFLRRPLASALAFSLLLHLLLVFGPGWPHPERPAVPAGAMQVIVGARTPSAPSPEAPPVPRSASEKTKSAKTPSGASAPAVSQPSVPPVLTGSPSTPVVTAAASGAASSVSATAADGGGVTRSANAPQSIAASASAEGVNADALRQYRVDLAMGARRFRHYPAAARMRGEEGVVEVEVLLTRAGATPSVRLARGSGHALLDEQARTMVEQAVRVTVLPEGLRGREVLVPMPIRFSLDSD